MSARILLVVLVLLAVAVPEASAQSTPPPTYGPTMPDAAWFSGLLNLLRVGENGSLLAGFPDVCKNMRTVFGALASLFILGGLVHKLREGEIEKIFSHLVKTVLLVGCIGTCGKLIAESNSWVDEIARGVARSLNQPAAAEKRAVLEAMGSPGITKYMEKTAKDRSPSWTESIASPMRAIVAGGASMLMTGTLMLCALVVVLFEFVRFFLLNLSSVFLPLAIGALGTQTFTNHGITYILRMVGVLSWPIGFAVVYAAGTGLLTKASETYMASPAAGANLMSIGSTIAFLAMFCLVQLFVIIGTAVTPVMMGKFISQGANALSDITKAVGRTVVSATGAGASAAGAALHAKGFEMLGGGGAGAAGSAGGSALGPAGMSPSLAAPALSGGASAAARTGASASGSSRGQLALGSGGMGPMANGATHDEGSEAGGEASGAVPAGSPVSSTSRGPKAAGSPGGGAGGAGEGARPPGAGPTSGRAYVPGMAAAEARSGLESFMKANGGDPDNPRAKEVIFAAMAGAEMAAAQSAGGGGSGGSGGSGGGAAGGGGGGSRQAVPAKRGGLMAAVQRGIGKGLGAVGSAISAYADSHGTTLGGIERRSTEQHQDAALRRLQQRQTEAALRAAQG